MVHQAKVILAMLQGLLLKLHAVVLLRIIDLDIFWRALLS